MRLIDGDRLLEPRRIGKYYHLPNGDIAIPLIDIEHAPSIDAVKHGRWIKMSDADGQYYCCSECGEELYRKWTFDREFDIFPKKESIEKTMYCSNCGARMDGEENG